MNLEVHVMGRNFAEAEPVLHFLNQEEIPHIFQEVGDDFDAQTPACYVGEKCYGADKIEKVKRAYHEMIFSL